MLRVLLAVVLMCAAAAGQTSNLQLSDEDRQFLERVSHPVVLKVAGMEAVRVGQNLTYKRAGNSELKADVYHASSPAAPMVLLVHGGMGPEFPVRPKDWGHYRSLGRLLAASGFTTVMFNHRAGFPKTELPAATDDLRDAIRWARSQAAAWKADGERVCVIAFSGGGPLLSLAMREPATAIRCQVGMYPIVDIQNLELTKGQMSAEDLATYSPVAQLERNPRAPALMLIRAGNDQIPSLLVGLDRMVAVALKTDAEVTVLNHPGAPHGFDNKLDTPRTREILKAMVAFLRAHLTK